MNVFFSKLRAVAKAADMMRSERRTHLLDAGVVCLQRMYLLVEGSSFFLRKLHAAIVSLIVFEQYFGIFFSDIIGRSGVSDDLAVLFVRLRISMQNVSCFYIVIDQNRVVDVSFRFHTVGCTGLGETACCGVLLAWV